jgi:DnaJ-class molecular chaperone
MPAPSGIDYYQALSIPKTAPREAIQKAYRAVALKSHPLKAAPDASQQAKTLSQVTFQNAAEAYQVLSNRTAVFIWASCAASTLG